MIKMQNRSQKHCPLCRADNVLNATDRTRSQPFLAADDF